MTTSASTGRMIRQLVSKDWQLVRGPVMAYGLLALISLALMFLENQLLFTVGSIVLITVVVIVGAQLVFGTVVNERKQQTLPFVMSLPITYMQYSAAKLIANLGIFLVAWLAIYTVVVAMIASRDGLANGLIPFSTIVLLELFIAFALTLAVAIVSESETWSVVVMSVGNVSVSIFIISMASIPAIGSHIHSPSAVWNSTAITIVAIEVALVLAIVCVSLFLQSRKHDFL